MTLPRQIWDEDGSDDRGTGDGLGPAPAQAPELVGRASVIDGDTIEIHGERIRLFGIDAIEAHQTCTLPTGAKWRCGGDAAKALAGHLAQKPTSCAVRGTDRYKRSVAVCRTADSGGRRERLAGAQWLGDGISDVFDRLCRGGSRSKPRGPWHLGRAV